MQFNTFKYRRTIVFFASSVKNAFFCSFWNRWRAGFNWKNTYVSHSCTMQKKNKNMLCWNRRRARFFHKKRLPRRISARKTGAHGHLGRDFALSDVGVTLQSAYFLDFLAHWICIFFSIIFY